MTGSKILIVGQPRDHFIAALRQALEDCGAAVKVVRDSKRVVLMLDRSNFTAAVLGVPHEGEDALLNRIVSLPTVFYGPETDVPAIVVAVLKVAGITAAASASQLSRHHARGTDFAQSRYVLTLLPAVVSPHRAGGRFKATILHAPIFRGCLPIAPAPGQPTTS